MRQKRVKGSCVHNYHYPDSMRKCILSITGHLQGCGQTITSLLALVDLSHEAYGQKRLSLFQSNKKIIETGELHLNLALKTV